MNVSSIIYSNRKEKFFQRYFHKNNWIFLVTVLNIFSQHSEHLNQCLICDDDPVQITKEWDLCYIEEWNEKFFTLLIFDHCSLLLSRMRDCTSKLNPFRSYFICSSTISISSHRIFYVWECTTQELSIR